MAHSFEVVETSPGSGVFEVKTVTTTEGNPPVKELFGVLTLAYQQSTAIDWNFQVERESNNVSFGARS